MADCFERKKHKTSQGNIVISMIRQIQNYIVITTIGEVLNLLLIPSRHKLSKADLFANIFDIGLYQKEKFFILSELYCLSMMLSFTSSISSVGALVPV